MTPSSHRRAEEKNAELSSSSVSSRSTSHWPPGGSREAAHPGAASDTLALGHRKRKLGSKARPHWRNGAGNKVSSSSAFIMCILKWFPVFNSSLNVSSFSPWHSCRHHGNRRSPPWFWRQRRRPPPTSWSPEPWCSWCLPPPAKEEERRRGKWKELDF